MINKFLHPNGGSETYMFKLGECLEKNGHEVQYFGMDHEHRCVSNKLDIYTNNMDFHHGNIVSKISYPIKTIYSVEARKKIRMVLNHFKPDICHINNFNYQLTPSIILEIEAWRKKNKKDCKIIYTAHDYQLVCPNHMCKNVLTGKKCEACLNGNYLSCIKNRCIHTSLVKSMIGALEATIWHHGSAYKQLDGIICCSQFMKEKLDTNKLFRNKTIVMHNFIDDSNLEKETIEKKDYVLYFGRYSKEKGIETLVEACRKIPEIRFVFAGSGALDYLLNDVSNIKDVGFKSGETLKKLVAEALFTVYPSEWYENCPFSVMESQTYGTPVLGANIGGIPELIQKGKTGELFESGNVDDLVAKIKSLYEDRQKIEEYSKQCQIKQFDTVDEYYEKLMKIYTDKTKK